MSDIIPLTSPSQDQAVYNRIWKTVMDYFTSDDFEQRTEFRRRFLNDIASTRHVCFSDEGAEEAIWNAKTAEEKRAFLRNVSVTMNEMEMQAVLSRKPSIYPFKKYLKLSQWLYASYKKHYAHPDCLEEIALRVWENYLRIVNFAPHETPDDPSKLEGLRWIRNVLPAGTFKDEVKMEIGSITHVDPLRAPAAAVEAPPKGRLAAVRRWVEARLG